MPLRILHQGGFGEAICKSHKVVEDHWGKADDIGEGEANGDLGGPSFCVGYPGGKVVLSDNVD